ncbi:chloride channel protein [Alicyclobacillus mengziensis]|uniref:Chloride channel protein n=1 Tax=Alicyclobacillus mengziensis TaxID=2931921 RepID=A0A9X7VX20_9BACL|nr:chloride channel protein [Alicyclobacillus mengziensis]QSO46599.1 chloride channel protein [Alicyclobacillus mengziensis]
MSTSAAPPKRRTNSLSLHSRISQHIPESVIILLYALAVGIVAGFGAVGFRKLIRLFEYVFFGHVIHVFSFMGKASVLFLPAIGLIIVAYIVKIWAPEAKGHGVPEVMEAIAEKKSIIRPRVVVIKAVASALTIGTGGSVGREGPIVQIGSAFGSVLGQFMGLPERYLRLLVACGAGGGIAATFNAPMGGMMFGIEVILASFSLQNFAAVMVSSVVSSLIGREFFGNHASLSMPLYNIGPLSFIWIYVILGIVTGLWSYVYIRVLYGVEDLFNMARWPLWIKAAVGGLAVGVLGIWYPQVLRVGYGHMNAALALHLAWSLMLVLLILKLIATSLTIAAGGSGGVFSPALYQGVMLGGAMGMMFVHFFPHSGLSAGAIAATAMAGIFAGSAQAPVTAILMIFDMTDDYKMILPLMIVSVLSATVVGLLSKESIYTLKLFRRGLDITRKRNPDKMQAYTVGEALPTRRHFFKSSETIEEAWTEISETDEWFADVRNDEGDVLGSVPRAKILESLQQGRGSEMITVLLPEKLYRIDYNESVAAALYQMHSHGVTYLLVLKDGKPVGVIGSSDIINVYRSEDFTSPIQHLPVVAETGSHVTP